MQPPHDPSGAPTESRTAQATTGPPPVAGEPAGPPALVGALHRLVRRGVLTPAQADAVLREAGADPAAHPGAVPTGRRRLFAEIAGYLGAAFVVGATVLYLGQAWEELGRGGRFAILAAMAAVLFGSGLAVRWRADPGGSPWWAGRPTDDVRRRLASTLLTGAAVAAASAVNVILQPVPDDFTVDTRADDWAAWAACATAFVVVVVGYLVARSAVGQLGAAVAAFAVLISTLVLIDVQDPGAYGVGILAIGVGWAVLAWRRLLAERRFAVAVAVAFALVGAQVTVAQSSNAGSYLGYGLTAAVAAACFAAYARVREWIVLAGGVIGATLVVPEFLYDVTDGSFGASGVMLAAGVTLLGASLAGLRIRRSVDPAAAPDATPPPTGVTPG